MIPESVHLAIMEWYTLARPDAAWQVGGLDTPPGASATLDIWGYAGFAHRRRRQRRGRCRCSPSFSPCPPPLCPTGTLGASMECASRPTVVMHAQLAASSPMPPERCRCMAVAGLVRHACLKDEGSKRGWRQIGRALNQRQHLLVQFKHGFQRIVRLQNVLCRPTGAGRPHLSGRPPRGR